MGLLAPPAPPIVTASAAPPPIVTASADCCCPLLFLVRLGIGKTQVSLTLATLAKPGKDWANALGYDLSKDALRFLRSVELPKGKLLRLAGTCLDREDVVLRDRGPILRFGGDHS